MKTTLSAEQIAQYQRDGFTLIEDFLSPEELAELKEAVFTAVDSLGKRKVTGDGVNWEDDAGYYGQVFTQKLNLWRISDTVRRYMTDPALGELICNLEGIDGIRVWHDQALIKPAWGNPTAWHLDNPYWSFNSRHSISIWIALEDATVHNGCLYFLPGTHHEASFENVTIGQNVGSLFEVYPQWRDRPATPVPMRAGSCSFHNGLCAHGAGANMTHRTRAAMTCAYMPTGSTFNGAPNILPPDYLATLSVGDELNSEAHNPLLFAR